MIQGRFKRNVRTANMKSRASSMRWITRAAVKLTLIAVLSGFVLSGCTVQEKSSETASDYASAISAQTMERDWNAESGTESIPEQGGNTPAVERGKDNWLYKVYDPDSEDVITVWYLYRVPISTYEHWSDGNYPEWEKAPLLSELYQLGKDDAYIYLMDAPTSVSELYYDASKAALFYNAQLEGKEYLRDFIRECGMQENPNWEALYDQYFCIDPSISFETAYTTISDSGKGLTYLVPADRQACYAFSEEEDICVERLASYNSSCLSLDIGSVAQWTIKRVALEELELAKEADATFCCTLGSDTRYAYYLSLTTGLRWLENDTYSESRYRAEMQEGGFVIAKFLDLNDITPDDDWIQRFAAEYAEP